LRILFIEDEDRLREALCRGLRAEDHDVVGASTGSEGLHLAEAESFDVIVCDILLPHLNGFQICQRLRQQANWTAGADDYLTKPFSFVVLRAHLRALARRGAKSAPTDAITLRGGDLLLDYRSRRCVRGASEVELSRREFDLLGALLTNPGETISKVDLMRQVWGPDFDGDPNIVEVYIGYLRRKIDTPFNRRSLETVRGFGYRLTVDDQTR
jgi:two-component system OmpR family response regulator